MKNTVSSARQDERQWRGSAGFLTLEVLAALGVFAAALLAATTLLAPARHAAALERNLTEAGALGEGIMEALRTEAVAYRLDQTGQNPTGTVPWTAFWQALATNADAATVDFTWAEAVDLSGSNRSWLAIGTNQVRIGQAGGAGHAARAWTIELSVAPQPVSNWLSATHVSATVSLTPGGEGAALWRLIGEFYDDQAL